MKKLVRKVTLLCLILLIFLSVYVGVFFYIVPPQYTQTYQASLLDKVKRLEEIQTPKIILVGNSNMALGIKSEMIEQEIKMPVVNLGLHGGMGNKFLERIALLGISEGDIVIVAHTDYSDDGTINQPDLAWITLENHRELWRIIDARECLEMLPALPNYIRLSTSLFFSGRGNQAPDEDYQRSVFNQYGDLAITRDGLLFEFEDGMVEVPSISKKCIKRLNAMNDYCNKQGAVMLIAAYPIAWGKFTPDQSEYVDFQMKLEEAVDCEVISDYTDYFLKYEYFYDTQYHLNDHGAEVRTRQLIEDIQNWNLEVDFIDG